MSCSNHGTFDRTCLDCWISRTRLLEDSLQRIGMLCLHTPSSLIWEEVRTTVGTEGEKRVTGDHT